MKQFFKKIFSRLEELDTKKQIFVIVGAILTLITYLYVVGLIGQRMEAYIDWMGHKGLTSDYLMRPISYNILYSIGFVFTLKGLKWLAIVSLASILIAYIIYKRRNKGEYNDDRGFVRSKSNMYGSAHLLSYQEIKNKFDVGDPLELKGTILGETKNKVVCLKNDDYGNKNIAIFGSSGTGKSRAVIRNQLFQKIRNEESIIVTDPKGELYADTKLLFERAQYHIRVLNVVELAHSDGWNCMDILEDKIEYAHTLAKSLIMNSSDNVSGDSFWDNGAENLLKALILYVATDEDRTPEEKNLAEVYNLLMQNNETTLNVMFSMLDDTSLAKRCYNLYSDAPDNVRQSVYSGLGTRLKLLQSEEVQAFFASSDIDLTLPAKRKCIYYIISSDTENTRSAIISLFFTSLMDSLLRYADKTITGRCDVPVNFIMDEFNNIGKLGVSSDGSDFCKFISVCRSRNISVTIAVQGLGQLKNRYPNSLWTEILANCRTQLLLGCADGDTAKYFSDKSGDMTIEYCVNSKNQRTGQTGNTYGESKQYARRKLFLPNELMELDNSEMLCFCTGVNVMKLKKFDYTKHPIYLLIEKSNANAYVVNRKTNYCQKNDKRKKLDLRQKCSKSNGYDKICRIDNKS